MKAVIFTALGFVFSAYASQASASCGTFEVAKGDVKVTAAGKESAAANGSKICSGDTVTAGKDSRAKIKMEDGNELNISPDSKIVIETYQYDASANKKKVLLNVLKGKVRATTKTENMYNDKAKDGQANAFQVRTKSAVAGVRGTDFLTGYDQKSNTTTIVTFRGKVEVGMPGPGGLSLKTVQVAVGQKTEITGGQAPAIPKMLPAADLNKINVESISPPPAAAAPAPAPATTGASNGSASPATGDREPASASPVTAGPAPGSMISTTDLGTNPKTALELPKRTADMPVIPVIKAPELPQFVKDKLTDSKVTVRLRTSP